MEIYSLKRTLVKLLVLFMLAGCFFFNTGCAVSQWRREHLGDPIMLLDGDGAGNELELHLFPLKEGSVGGYGAAGGAGGCGC